MPQLQLATPKPYWRSECGRFEMWHGDCNNFKQTKDKVILTDPPYGIDLDCDDEASGGVGRQAFKSIVGDSELFDPRWLMQYNDCILFGCNNYCNAIPPKQGQWYFWDKTLQNNGCRIAEGEFCWHKQGTKPRAFRHLWSGAYRASEHNQRSVHPAQKPIALMTWCLQHLAIGDVFDPFAGSGTVGVACVETNRKYIGVEIDLEYCKIAVGRIQRAMMEKGLMHKPNIDELTDPQPLAKRK